MVDSQSVEQGGNMRMKAQEDLAGAIVELIAQVAPAAPSLVSDHDRPLAEQGLDSLDHSALLLAVEECYGFKIPDSDVDHLDTVNRIAAYVAARNSAPGNP